LLLFDSIDLIECSLQELKASKGEKSKKILEKFDYVLNKNKGFEKIKIINAIINGIDVNSSDVNLSPEELSVLKWAPITTCDVERSFSRHKFILNDRHYNFSESHLKQYFIVNVNKDFLRNC